MICIKGLYSKGLKGFEVIRGAPIQEVDRIIDAAALFKAHVELFLSTLVREILLPWT